MGLESGKWENIVEREVGYILALLLGNIKCGYSYPSTKRRIAQEVITCGVWLLV